jgi:glycerophosphoryl diester phosphodiesterase
MKFSRLFSAAILSLIFTCSCAQRGQARIKPTSHSWQVIAHRGAPGYLPEHTLAGVAMAAGWGVDFVEPDVVLSRDNVPVVLHDIHLDMNTDVAQKFPFRKRPDGRYYVKDFRLKELKTLRVLERSKEKNPSEAVFPKRFPRTLNSNSFEIPTLEEYLELVQGLRQSTGKSLGVYPEIKNSDFHASEGQDIVKVVYDMLVRFGYEKTPELIYIQSFNPKDLLRLRNEMQTRMPLAQLVGKNSDKESGADYEAMMTDEGLSQVASYAQALAPSLDQVLTLDPASKKLVASSLTHRAHQVGLKVHAYTHRQDPLPRPLKSNEELFSLLKHEAQIDGLFSDFADEVLKWDSRLKD